MRYPAQRFDFSLLELAGYRFFVALLYQTNLFYAASDR